jgi:hypothetical protein
MFFGEKKKIKAPFYWGGVWENFPEKTVGGVFPGGVSPKKGKNTWGNFFGEKKAKERFLKDFGFPLKKRGDGVRDGVSGKRCNPPKPLGNHPETGRPVFARMTKNGPGSSRSATWIKTKSLSGLL